MFPSIEPSDVGVTGLIWLLASYGYILFYSSNLISEGSDLLLLVPSLAGLVGGVVLPLLGAVPDGAIMLFSGLGDIEEAQETLSVGVGALAGSTIMLLTVPWAMSVFSGAVDLVGPDQTPNYKGSPKLSEKSFCASLNTTGVALTPEINKGAKMMLFTTLPYFLIQVPAYYLTGTREEVSEGEHYWALAGLIVCITFFLGYLAMNIKMSNDSANKLRRTAVIKEALKKGRVSLSGALAEEVTTIEANIHNKEVADSKKEGTESELLAGSNPEGYPPTEVAERLKEIVTDAFNGYDENRNGTLEKKEFAMFLTDFNETVSSEKLDTVFAKYDTDNNGTIDLDEFIAACYTIIKQKASPDTEAIVCVVRQEILNGDDDCEEAEEVPEDLVDLSPDKQQRAIKIRAFSMLALGTALVLIFSDPMVDVMSEIAVRADIPAFYVSFILAPLASNASEVIASQYYASKKTRKTITVSLTALEGAASMNNTFCLAIFMGLIYFRGLAWSYSAETIAIVLVQLILAIYAQQKLMTAMRGWLVMTIFPLSILFVWGLERLGMD